MLKFTVNVSNGCKVVLLLCIVQSALAGVVDNTVNTERPRISSSNELISTILNNCYDMNCLKSNVLNYLNTYLNVNDRDARSMHDVDEQIYDRVARILKTKEFRMQLPETFFRKSEITFQGGRGFDVKVSEDAAVEARKHKDDDIKKKLLLPALLLLKLKLKAILPIFVALIGLKAIKALILSKLAITLVVGFIAYSLLKKPATPATPETSTTAAPASSYDPSSWEPSASAGGPYARVWDPSAQNLAYSAYYSGSSTGSGSSASGSATSKPSYSTI